MCECSALLHATSWSRSASSNKKAKKSLWFERLNDESNTNNPQTPKSILKTPKRKIDEENKIEKNCKTNHNEHVFQEIADLMSLRSDSETTVCDWWIEDLHLKCSEIIKTNKKLTSYHMEAVNIICRKQFPNIGGF